MALVELRNVTKHYHKGGETIKPLDGVTMDIAEGEFISLMGASGTGKSTLLNVIASIDRPDSGRITVNDTVVTEMSRTRLAGWRAANIGYIFQTHNLIPVLTSAENIEMPLLLLPMSKKERRSHVDAALNADGELFTFDADMEWDMNTPWYRPTRVCHVVSGAEFGWRNGGIAARGCYLLPGDDKSSLEVHADDGSTPAARVLSIQENHHEY